MERVSELQRAERDYDFWLFSGAISLHFVSNTKERDEFHFADMCEPNVCTRSGWKQCTFALILLASRAVAKLLPHGIDNDTPFPSRLRDRQFERM